MRQQLFSRRDIVKTGALCAALGPLAWRAGAAGADVLVELRDYDPLAKALGYHSNVRKISAKKFPRYQPGQRCAVCQHAKTTASEGVLGCVLFPGKRVSPDGWCTSWSKRT